MKHRIVEIYCENETVSYLCKWRYRFALLENRKFLWFTYWKTIASSDNPANFGKITNNHDIKIEYMSIPTRKVANLHKRLRFGEKPSKMRYSYSFQFEFEEIEGELNPCKEVAMRNLKNKLLSL